MAGGFVPDPERLYEVGRDGLPYTLSPEPPGAAAVLEVRARRWWVAAILANGAAMGIAAGAVMLGSRVLAAWLGILPLLTAPLLLVAPLLRRFAPRRLRRVHRRRPGEFPPPPSPPPPALRS